MTEQDIDSVLNEINKIKEESNPENSEYLASFIFKYNNRVISAAVIQALHKISSENEGAPVMMPSFLIDPASPNEFCLYVLDIFGIKNRGTCVVGIVSSGSLGYGNPLILKKADGRDILTECEDIPFFHEQDTIEPGDNIGIFLKDITMGEVAQGDAVSSK